MQAGGAESDESARKALAAFCEVYWPPLYTFLRRRGYSQADAQDIVQGFFEHVFQHNTLSRADQEKGRLRTFLLGSLQNFLLKERERMRALKRGGAHQFVSFDEQLFGYEKNNIFSVFSQSPRRARNVRVVHCSSKKRRTWLTYACWLYQAKKDSLSQAASAASNLRYELAARIARRFANFAAKAIAPFGKF